MNNWRLLLLAVVVVVQPLGSFTESNLLDGRECCERSEDTRLYGYRKTDERRSLHEIRENRQAVYDNRRLRSDVREERRYDRSPVLTVERYGIRSFAKLSRSAAHRLVEGQERRGLDTFAQNKACKDPNRNHYESRHFLDQTERDSREPRSRDAMDASRTFRISREERDTHSAKRQARNSLSLLPIRTFRSIEERRFTENRHRSALNRENVAHSHVRLHSRLGASVRSDGRHQLGKTERSIFDSRAEGDGTDFRHSRFSEPRPNELRAVRAQKSIEQNERQNRLSRDKTISIQRIIGENEQESRLNSRNMLEERRLQISRLNIRKFNKDSRNKRLARNRDEIRGERVLVGRRQDSCETVKDSREVRLARHRDEVRSERVLAERRDDSRVTVADSREVPMTRNRDEVRKRVLAERRKDNRETVKGSREVRVARERDVVSSERVLAKRRQERRETQEIRVARDRDEVRERVLAERRQKKRVTVKYSRVVRVARDRDDVRDGRVLAERRQDSRREVQVAKDQDEVRVERILAERRQESRETREIRMARDRDEVRSERVLAEQENRDAIKDSRDVQMSRNRDEVGERMLAERRQEKRDIVNDSREARIARNLIKIIDVRVYTARKRQDTKNDMRANDFVLERDNIERETRPESVRSVMNHDALVQDDARVFSNWQMVFYTLQGVYLCGLLMQMLTENSNKNKKRHVNWWSSAKDLIKVD